MKFFITLFLMIFTNGAVAGITQDKIEINIHHEQIDIVPKSGFHINAQAPASGKYDDSAGAVKPKIKTEQKLNFLVPKDTKKANLKFFVCDDAKTVCEQHEHSVDLTQKNQLKNAGSNDLTEPVKAQKPVATKTNTSTLLIFSAPWCPACIRMATETYTKPKIKQIFSKINVKKINIDLVENEKISKQFSVTAIPTVILLNASGEEVYRWLDYQPALQFTKELAAEIKNTESAVELKTRADAGDLVAAEKLAKIYLGQMDWKNAEKYFSLLSDDGSKNQKLNCSVNYFSESKDKDDSAKKEYLENLEKAFKATTSKIDQLRWQIEYLETAEDLKDSKNKKMAEEVLQALNELLDKNTATEAYLKSTVGDMSGFEIIETLDMRARTEKLLGQTESVRKSYQKIVEVIKAKKHDVNFPGQMINSIGYLTQANSLLDAEKLIQQLVAKYPKTYVYHQRYAGFLSKQKRSDEALLQINQALKYKEGNEPQLNLAKIKILKALDKKPEAEQLTDETLKLVELAPEKYKRTKSALLDFKKEFSIKK